MPLAVDTPNFLQRLTRLPKRPDIQVYQMVLHRPIKSTPFIGHWRSSGSVVKPSTVDVIGDLINVPKE